MNELMIEVCGKFYGKTIKTYRNLRNLNNSNRQKINKNCLDKFLQ